ncbi:hypothetical protein NM688_g7105 [Phlebia brevispora]|uniref:Uncharacterized protein n=1 Tax=Phlebia brevispora TaxID=194682 RepID=A0ACC1S930_9APHY|nr:hypothetical protein NM688_g7105 [Phlebia brevispora]
MDTRTRELEDEEEKSARVDGWAGLDKIVREMDERKINDHKEDLDTLLVFAGLFSAVSTACIVESYTYLQEDNSAATVQLLKLHLIFSLVTASIGMLVKQWLREYLGGNFVGPRARLRIHHYREPGLATWKVVEIVAMLPLLLHIALGLFLAGLCIFAYSINEVLGRTCIPLVVGWAFFLLATTVAPIFSQRCPYKTSYFKGAIRVLRRLLYNAASDAERNVHRAFRHARRYAGTASADTLQMDTLDSNRGTDAETDAARCNSGSQDRQLLLSIDAKLLDDDILCTYIFTALRGMDCSSGAIVDFVLRVVAHRLVVDSDRGIPLPADLRSLSRRAWSSMMELLTDTLCRGVLEYPTRLHWMKEAVLLLLSRFSGTSEWRGFATRIGSVIKNFTAQQRTALCDALSSCQCMGNTMESAEMLANEFLRNCVFVLQNACGAADTYSYVQEIIGRRICGSTYTSNFVLSEFWAINEGWSERVSHGNLLTTAQLIADLMNQDLSAVAAEPCQQTRPPWMAEALSFIVAAVSITDAAGHSGTSNLVRDALHKKLGALLANEYLSPALFMSLASSKPKAIGRTFTLDTLYEIHVQESTADIVADNFSKFVAERRSCGNLEDAMRIAYLALRLMKLPLLDSPRKKWKSILLDLKLMLDRRGLYASYVSSAEQDLAGSCLALVHTLNPKESFFPVELVSALRRMANSGAVAARFITIDPSSENAHSAIFRDLTVAELPSGGSGVHSPGVCVRLSSTTLRWNVEAPGRLLEQLIIRPDGHYVQNAYLFRPLSFKLPQQVTRPHHEGVKQCLLMIES